MDEKNEKVRDKLIEDCFGNVAGRKHCHVLIEDVCLYGKCPFYKTRAQFEKDRNVHNSSKTARGQGTSRSVRCLETGRIYPSIRSAARELGISEYGISLVLRGKKKTTHGMRFEYI